MAERIGRKKSILTVIGTSFMYAISFHPSKGRRLLRPIQWRTVADYRYDGASVYHRPHALLRYDRNLC